MSVDRVDGIHTRMSIYNPYKDEHIHTQVKVIMTRKRLDTKRTGDMLICKSLS